MNLLIVESKGKVEELTSILGPSWKVVPSFGHVCDLPKNDIAVAPPLFIPEYVLSERGLAVTQRLADICKQASAIYLGMDPDREGEAIAHHLQRILGLRDYRRVAFAAITESDVRKAIANPRRVDARLVAAQEARRVLDRLVGYMVSPRISDMGGQRLSAGRVQTPAVMLLVERENAIQQFRAVDHFGVRLDFAPAKFPTPSSDFAEAKTPWSAFWEPSEGFLTADEPYFLDEQAARQVAQVRRLQVTEFTATTRRRAPPAPFNTSTMQQAASVKLGMNPEETMKVAQRLFEAGYITYHRTDNPNISDESLPAIAAEAERLGLPMAPTQRHFKAPESAQAGHPAITPTHWETEVAGDDSDEQALYALIRIRALACQLADASYSVRTAKLVGDVGGRAATFKAVGEQLTHAGWLAILARDDTDEDTQDKPANAVPSLAVGDQLAASNGELLRIKTRAPKRYTQASLIAKLEAEGIGRPATYASIMANIVARGYVTEKARFLYPTETGSYIANLVKGRFSFAEVAFTRQVEGELDRIAAGAVSYNHVIQESHKRLVAELGNLDGAGVQTRFPCPECGKPMRRIDGKSGVFWGCSDYPTCNATRPDNKGQPGEQIAPIPSKFDCLDCGKPLIRRTKKGKSGYDFWGCSGFRDGCKATFENKRGKPDFKINK